MMNKSHLTGLSSTNILNILNNDELTHKKQKAKSRQASPNRKKSKLPALGVNIQTMTSDFNSEE